MRFGSSRRVALQQLWGSTSRGNSESGGRPGLMVNMRSRIGASRLASRRENSHPRAAHSQSSTEPDAEAPPAGEAADRAPSDDGIKMNGSDAKSPPAGDGGAGPAGRGGETKGSEIKDNETKGNVWDLFKQRVNRVIQKGKDQNDKGAGGGRESSESLAAPGLEVFSKTPRTGRLSSRAGSRPGTSDGRSHRSARGNKSARAMLHKRMPSLLSKDTLKIIKTEQMAALASGQGGARSSRRPRSAREKSPSRRPGTSGGVKWRARKPRKARVVKISKEERRELQDAKNIALVEGFDQLEEVLTKSPEKVNHVRDDWTLDMVVQSGHGLPAVEGNIEAGKGYSDPFVEISLLNVNDKEIFKRRSPIRRRSLNPDFNYRVKGIPRDVPGLFHTMVVEVLSHNIIQECVFMGRATLSRDEIINYNNQGVRQFELQLEPKDGKKEPSKTEESEGKEGAPAAAASLGQLRMRINLKEKQCLFRVRIQRAKGLRSLGSGARSVDPFVKFEVLDDRDNVISRGDTQIEKNTLSPAWGYPVRLGKKRSRNFYGLRMEVWNRDDENGDDFMGQCSISREEILSQILHMTYREARPAKKKNRLLGADIDWELGANRGERNIDSVEGKTAEEIAREQEEEEKRKRDELTSEDVGDGNMIRSGGSIFSLPLQPRDHAPEDVSGTLFLRVEYEEVVMMVEKDEKKAADGKSIGEGLLPPIQVVLPNSARGRPGSGHVHRSRHRHYGKRGQRDGSAEARVRYAPETVQLPLISPGATDGKERTQGGDAKRGSAGGGEDDGEAVLITDITGLERKAKWDFPTRKVGPLTIGNSRLLQVDKIMEEELDCSNNLLLGIMPEIFDYHQNLVFLALNNNNISSLPEGIFDELPNLKSLRLQRNWIEELPPKIFDKLVNLESLWLQRNQIKHLDVKIFEKLENMTHLHLQRNRIKKFPMGIFDKTIALQGLFLFGNKNKYLTDGLFDFLVNCDVFVKPDHGEVRVGIGCRCFMFPNPEIKCTERIMMSKLWAQRINYGPPLTEEQIAAAKKKNKKGKGDKKSGKKTPKTKKKKTPKKKTSTGEDKKSKAVLPKQEVKDRFAGLIASSSDEDEAPKKKKKKKRGRGARGRGGRGAKGKGKGKSKGKSKGGGKKKKKGGKKKKAAAAAEAGGD